MRVEAAALGQRELGSVPPSAHPAAEETGLILPTANGMAKPARQLAREGVMMSLRSMSGAATLRGNLPGTVARVLAETGLPAPPELELTDTVMANAEQTITIPRPSTAF